MPPFARLLPILAPLALVACLPQSPEPAPMPAPELAPDMPAELAADACGAADLQALVGQPFSALAAMTFAGPMRLIRPDMAVTMDYSPQRLNISVNEADVIDSVRCG